LRRRFQKTLLRRDEGGGKLRECAHRRIVAGGRRAVGLDQENAVAESATLTDYHREPALERPGIGDVADLDCPFDAARIGEGADRVGR
jgi:hypothetical protein